MTFIESCRKRWWRLWSVQFHALLAAIIGYLAAAPDAMIQIMNALPPEMRGVVPPLITFGLIGLGTLTRIVKQKDVADAQKP